MDRKDNRFADAIISGLMGRRMLYKHRHVLPFHNKTHRRRLVAVVVNPSVIYLNGIDDVVSFFESAWRSFLSTTTPFSRSAGCAVFEINKKHLTVYFRSWDIFHPPIFFRSPERVGI